MKKLNSLFALLLVALFASSAARAAQVSVTINFDNPEAVLVQVGYQDVDVVAGANVFNVEEYTMISVRAIPPYAFKSITQVETGTHQSVYGDTWYLTASSYTEGTYDVVTYNQDETRSASCTVNVDNASKVSCVRGGTYTEVALENGENTVKYDPETENQLIISAIQYNVPLYKVTLDGVNVPATGSSFNVNLTEGCVVDITAEFPDEDVNVTFSYSPDGEGAISSVMVDNTTVEDFDGKSLVVKLGQKLTLVPNNAYKFVSTKINDVDIQWGGTYQYEFTVVDNTLIDIDAHPYGNISATVEIDNPDNIVLYHGYSYMNDIVELSAGANVIEISESNTLLSWSVKQGCFISSVTLNGEPLDSYTTSVYMEEGDVLAFVTGIIVMDKQTAVWVDDITAANYYFSFAGSDRVSINLASGYNVVDFYDGMNPFSLGWAGSGELVNQVYINNQLTEPLYEGGSSYQMDIASGDVIKVFLASEPVECSVNVTLDEGVNADVTSDIIVPVTDFGNPFSAFKGTEIWVTPAEDEDIVVKSNCDVNIVDGIYVVTVNDVETTISVEKGTTGIESISSAKVNDGAVYNMLGVKVGNADDASRLPAGVYVVNGKKVVIK